MEKTKYEKPYVYEKSDGGSLSGGGESTGITRERRRKSRTLRLAEAISITRERYENPESEEVRFVIRKMYKPEYNKEAEESVKIWEILERNGFNVPRFYFLTEKDGNKVIHMEFLGEGEEFAVSLHDQSSKVPVKELSNLKDLAVQTLEDLARMHRLNISIGLHNPLSPWLLKIKEDTKEAELFPCDLSNLELTEELSQEREAEDLIRVIGSFKRAHNFDFSNYDLDPEKIYRDAYESFQPKKTETSK